MSQHFLDRPQIRPIFQQMGRKGVAERMRRNLLFDSGFLLIVLSLIHIYQALKSLVGGKKGRFPRMPMEHSPK